MVPLSLRCIELVAFFVIDRRDFFYERLQVFGVSQAIDVELCGVDSYDGMSGVEILRRCHRRNHIVPPSRVESVKQFRLASEDRIIGEVIDDDEDLKQLLVATLLEKVCDLVLRLKYVG